MLPIFGTSKSDAIKRYIAALPSTWSCADRASIVFVDPFPEPRRKSKPRRQRKARAAPPADGLRSEAEAAAKLSISVKTLREHVAAGALRYVNVGRGKHRERRRFTDADLNEFIVNQSRKDSPCLSIAPAGRRSGIMISGAEVIGFTALRKRRRDGKPKR